MRKVLQFTIPGEARGKGRPKFVRATGHAYTPEQTASYENLVKVKAQEAMGALPPFSEAVAVAISVWKGIPASWSKKRREAAAFQYAPTGFDVDNIAKSILDGMNGVAFIDDKIVCELSISKHYGPVPQVNVTMFLP